MTNEFCLCFILLPKCLSSFVTKTEEQISFSVVSGPIQCFVLPVSIPSSMPLPVELKSDSLVLRCQRERECLVLWAARSKYCSAHNEDLDEQLVTMFNVSGRLVNRHIFSCGLQLVLFLVGWRARTTTDH